jgi:hypothetical protein
MKGIFCVPKFDAPTEYSYEWNERLREQIGNKMDKILLLIADAVKSNVEKALKENPDVMLIHYDHGDTDRLIGQDEQPVVDLTNVSLLKGRVSYNMNCLSAQTLGKQAYKDGCLAYWGYVQVVSFTTDAEQDFCTAFNFGLLYWLQGHSWKECLDETRAEMTRIIDSLMAKGNTMAAMALMSDRDALHCWGSGIETPTEPCLVSRTISKLFGYRVLTRLRKFRDSIAGKKKQ